MQSFGKLYVVATPIGNLGDITVRAISVLKAVKCIAAEDTRESKKLLQHYGISTPLISVHAHNEAGQVERIINLLKSDQDIAYITDAGTPLISDPGALLVTVVRQAGLTVVPIPGPSAAIAALSVSGFQSPHFYFEGFLPNRSSHRQQRLASLKHYPATLIFYESPHRVLATMQDLLLVLGNRYGVIARELTKKFETIISGNLTDLQAVLIANEKQRLGEFVLLVAGNTESQAVDMNEINEIVSLLLQHLPIKTAVAIASKVTKLPKNELYDLALTIKSRQ